MLSFERKAVNNTYSLIAKKNFSDGRNRSIHENTQSTTSNPADSKFLNPISFVSYVNRVK